MPEGVDLPGFDDRGKVYISDERILRKISPEYRSKALELLDIFNANSLSERGFAPTTITSNDDELVLEHQRYPISFPYEWPSVTLKEAALFHLEKLVELEELGLTLKDCLPENVLFERGQPHFVDFLSIVRIEELAQEQWLSKGSTDSSFLRKKVIQQMFGRHFLVPLLAYEAGMTKFARKVLRSHACRMRTRKYHLGDLVLSCPPHRLPKLLFRISRYAAAFRYGPSELYTSLARMIGSITLHDTKGYARYYARKNEDFALDPSPDWKSKQQSVHTALKHFSRESLLDIGANTGWFSKLAVKNGYTVTSTDIDESSLNAFFKDVRHEALPVTVAKCAWGDLDQRIGNDGKACESSAYFSSLLDRMEPDVIMMLGLIHHLALGENRTLHTIFSTIAENCSAGAIVEFIALEDELIADNPGYFPNIRKWNTESYNLEVAKTVALTYFANLEVHPSHPGTRTILILEK